MYTLPWVAVGETLHQVGRHNKLVSASDVTTNLDMQQENKRNQQYTRRENRSCQLCIREKAANKFQNQNNKFQGQNVLSQAI